MRSLTVRALVVLSLVTVGVVLVNACTGSSPGGNVTPTADLAMKAPDLATPPDLTPPPPPPDLTMPPPDLAKAQGTDGSVMVQCASKADCNGNPCCLEIKGAMLAGLSCAKAMNECVPKIDILSQGGQTRVCASAADCTSGGVTTDLKECCDAMQGGNKTKICFNKTFAQFSMGAITCP